jgi:hypothetical protein
MGQAEEKVALTGQNNGGNRGRPQRSLPAALVFPANLFS